MSLFAYVNIFLIAEAVVVLHAQPSRDPCTNSPCLNSGQCIVINYAPVCICPPGFSGQFCATNTSSQLSKGMPDPCMNFKCKNRGTCQAPNYVPVCICLPGFTGRFCDQRIGPGYGYPCEYNYCQNGGLCHTTRGGPFCECQPGYTGWMCQERTSKTDPCPTTKCENGGSCQVPNNVPVCVCLPGFTGRFCEQSVFQWLRDPCRQFTYCKNGGTCELQFDRETCVCPPGTDGMLCERIMNPCATYFCQNGGTCNASNNMPVCVCLPGFTGTFCGQKLATRDPCVTIKCQNGGTCHAPNDVPVCVCPAGFTGRFCERRIISRDPCLYFDCKYGGICVAPLDYPICQCPDGYGGVHCENSVLEKPGTCITIENPDNGTCTKTCDGDFDCPNAQKCCRTFCERTCTDNIVLDPCHGFCLNGGACTAPADDPICECPSGYSGRRCEIASKPNLNGSCPAIKPGSQSVCGGTFCTTDAQCRSGQKCCPSACGGTLCTNVGIPAPISSPIICSDLVCANDTVCRYVAICESCHLEPRCIPKTQAGEEIDAQCRRHRYFEVVLLEDEKDRNLFNQMKCSGPSCTPDCKCPSGSICIGDQTEEKLCCRGKIGPVVPAEKPGACPSGNVSVCGGVVCQNDHECSGDQKCCPGCGKMCTAPVTTGKEEQCGKTKCLPGQTCVSKVPYCNPERGCFRALLRVCVPLGCAKCSVGEQCRMTRYGYECYLTNPTDRCGRCGPRQVCKTPDIKCGNSSCPSFSCVPFNKCGVCPQGQICRESLVPCSKSTCSSFNCVPLDDCGGCPLGDICKETLVPCSNKMCPVRSCVPLDKCGGCPKGQVCKGSPMGCSGPACTSFTCSQTA